MTPVHVTTPDVGRLGPGGWACRVRPDRSGRRGRPLTPTPKPTPHSSNPLSGRRQGITSSRVTNQVRETRPLLPTVTSLHWKPEDKGPDRRAGVLLWSSYGRTRPHLRPRDGSPSVVTDERSSRGTVGVDGVTTYLLKKKKKS